MSDFFSFPLPNGFLSASASLYPCSLTMRATRRVPSSVTPSATATSPGTGGRWFDGGGIVSCHAMVASSVRLSPLLSTQVMTTLSPLAPPLNLNDRNGFFDTAGPHCADSTVLSLQVAETLWMNQAGIVFP